METTLYKLLNNNEELINLIGENRIFPIFATDLKQCALEYEYRDLKSGIVNQSQFSINIIWNDYDFILNVKSLLNEILIDKLNTQYKELNGYKFNIMLSGGSSPLYRDDLKVYQINLNYIVKWIKI
ncbi:hypothetical protein HMPREF1092_00922 [Clostridium thermobutyricum]|uniref:DUF3168 domain-containing protein n=1 Tax=Clostridium thermobutyricum TaxID=29372 RepID=N9XPT2_9CLOT|nr:hypothetical protein [Clostridium thermobutyricum]ENZ01688.1 hypothetical protein HMPREF1092_00922 [Clostridium thermobutyricum]